LATIRRLAVPCRRAILAMKRQTGKVPTWVAIGVR
jgi:hypothetical protein